MMTRLHPPTPRYHRRPDLPPVRANVRTLATAAVFSQYPCLLSIAAPRSIVKRSEDGWIVTVWLCRSIYKRVAVRKDGKTELLPSEQPY